MFRQRNLPWVGALVESLYSSLPIVSVVNFLSIVTVLYTSVSEYLNRWVPWLSFGVFIGLVVVGVVLTMVCMYLWVLPSLWTFRNKQMNNFESDLLEEIQESRREIQELRKEIEKLSAH